MAANARNGRDKLTLLLGRPCRPRRVDRAARRREHGQGRPRRPADRRRADRQAVGVRRRSRVRRDPTGRGRRDLHEVAARMLEAAGHPVFEIEIAADELGAEFFRWEFATAVAGASLGVNPVRRAERARTPSPGRSRSSIAQAARGVPVRVRRSSAGRATRAASRRPRRRRHAGRRLRRDSRLSARRSRGAPTSSRRLRAALRERTRPRHDLRLGPRYLHSTGQYHKGGPNTGLFLLFTAVDAARRRCRAPTTRSAR